MILNGCLWFPYEVLFELGLYEAGLFAYKFDDDDKDELFRNTSIQ